MSHHGHGLPACERATGGRRLIVCATISVCCVELGSFCKLVAPARERRAAAATRALSAAEGPAPAHPSRRCRVGPPAGAGAPRHGEPKGTGRVRVPPCYSTKQRGYAKLGSFCNFPSSASPPRSGALAAAAARVAQDAPADSVRAPRIGPDRARAGSRRESPGRGSARTESARSSTLLPPGRFSPAWRDSGPGAAHRAPHHGPANAQSDRTGSCPATARSHARISRGRKSPTSPRPSPPPGAERERKPAPPASPLRPARGERDRERWVRSGRRDPVRSDTAVARISHHDPDEKCGPAPAAGRRRRGCRAPCRRDIGCARRRAGGQHGRAGA